MITFDKIAKAVASRVAKLQDEKFYGELVLTFREGNLVMTRQSETTPTDKLVSEELSLGTT